MSTVELAKNIRTASPAEPRWMTEIRTAYRDIDALCEAVGVTPPAKGIGDANFPVFATRSFVSRIRRGDPDDPLLRQVMPDPRETVTGPGEVSDPVGDLDASSGAGLLEKYEGRSLLITTPACGIHCRYCFRREFPYHEQSARRDHFAAAIERLSGDASVTEVLLSGGDPLMLSDPALGDLLERLGEVPHLCRVRIHTRMPVVTPTRVNEILVRQLQTTRLVPWMVLHINHAAEIDGDVAKGITRLVDGGVPLLNQSVLLAGVNDDVDTLCELSERLINLRVTPYYLHQLDPVRGAGHFRVDVSRGRGLIDAMRKRLPGYAVPRYVCEQPGEANKTPLG